uniref:Reverse transcriptase Ty1/copia-type domain-containing protein n=1 Tax=Trichogramma kaykai TaxID=54128 RepID=A0ABD2XIF9_9HYME
MPEGRAKKQKLMDPNFVYKAKVPELKIDDIELKTSPKIWNQRFTVEAKKLGLEKDLHEPCLFTWRKEGKVALLVLYVDDIILANNCMSRLNEIKDTLCNVFEMKNLGEPSKYLGMEITRNRAERVMKLSQVEYTNKVLERFRMDESKPQSTPMVTRSASQVETSPPYRPASSSSTLLRRGPCKEKQARYITKTGDSGGILEKDYSDRWPMDLSLAVSGSIAIITTDAIVRLQKSTTSCSPEYA